VKNYTKLQNYRIAADVLLIDSLYTAEKQAMAVMEVGEQTALGK
jgi:hypothetical protein